MAFRTNSVSLRGRTVLIEFRCGRCGETAIEPYERQQESAEGNLQSFRPPEGWLNDNGPVPFLMCPECKRQYYRFLRNEPLEGGKEEEQ